MGTAHIDCVIEPHEGTHYFGGCFECVAEIEYEIDDAALCNWYIRDFYFPVATVEMKKVDTAVYWERREVSKIWCPDILRPVLMHYADRKRIEDDLVDKLSASGELGSYADQVSADYRRSAL